MTNLTSTVTSISTSIDSEASTSSATLPSSGATRPPLIPTSVPPVAISTVRVDSGTGLPCFVLTCGEKGNVINIPMNHAQARCLGMDNPTLIGEPKVHPVQIFQNSHQIPSNQTPHVKPPTTVALPFKDPRDIAIGESLLQMIQPPKSVPNVPKTYQKNDMPFPKPNITNIRLVPMQMPLNVSAQRLPTAVYPRVMTVVQPPRQQVIETVRPPALFQRVAIPAFRPMAKPLAKTITTPSYTYSNMPRVCPVKIASPAVRPTLLQHVIQKQQFSPYIIKKNVQVQSLPVSQHPINQNKTAEVNRSQEITNALPQLRQLLMSPYPNFVVTRTKELPEDPIGLLVPEVEIVEDDNQQVTIPQWSPESKLKRKRFGISDEIEAKRCKIETVEMKRELLMLDKLDTSLMKNGQIDLSKTSKEKLFLPRAKIISKAIPLAVVDRLVPSIVNDDSKKVEEKEKAEPKMRCLVYKSCNFTHVIPLQDVISIPNELLDDLEASNTVPPCQQLENLLGLISVASNDDVEPEFEAMDLNSVSSVSLNSKLLEQLAKTYKSDDLEKRVKLNKLRDKLMTALATSKKKV